MQRIRHLLEMIRFSHTLFALPFALLAALMAWVAEAGPEERIVWRPWDLLGILLCMVFARSAAMSFNRIVDRKLDAANPRTAGRHLPAGVLSLPTVIGFAVANIVGFVLATLLFWPNPWPLYLSLPALAVLLGYSYTKRFTALAHFWLGGALMLAPVAAWIAIRGQIEWPPVVLGGAVLLWVAGFDIIYACQDYEYDRRAGLHSVPAKLGIKGALRVASLCHAGTIGLLLLLPLTFPPLGWIYLAGVAAVGVLLVYEHLLVRPDDLDRVNMAFFNVNIVISLGLLAVGAADLLL